MGRKKLDRAVRRLNVCITLSPKAYDMLDELIDNEGITASRYVENLITSDFQSFLHSTGMSRAEIQELLNKK